MRLTRKNWLKIEKFSERTLGLFKSEFVGTRGVRLTAKCYLVQNQNEAGENKESCKGVSKKHRYKDLLDVFHKTVIASELEGGILAKPRT